MIDDLLTAQSRLLGAALVGERFALVAASLVLMAIFWKPAFKYFADATLRRTVIFADQLAAGIYLTAAGMVFSTGVRVVLDVFWPHFQLALPMMILGVLVILAGQFLHVRAFASVVYPGFRRLSLYWTVGIALVAAAGVVLAMGIS